MARKSSSLHFTTERTSTWLATWLAAFTGHTDNVISLAFSDDGTMAVSGGKDGTARVWRLPAKPGQ